MQVWEWYIKAKGLRESVASCNECCFWASRNRQTCFKHWKALRAIDTQSSKPHGGKDAKYCVCVSTDKMTKTNNFTD